MGSPMGQFESGFIESLLTRARTRDDISAEMNLFLLNIFPITHTRHVNKKIQFKNSINSYDKVAV